MAASASISNSQLSPYVIQPEEYEELLAHTRTDTFAARRNRVSEFYRADSTNEMALRVLKIGGSTTLGLTVGGLIVGGCVGGPKGSLIGGGAGLGIGILFTVIFGTVEFRQNYKDWKCSIEDQILIDRFNEKHQQYADLTPFMCPINKEPITDPVQIPCGHTFERNLLQTWHDKAMALDILPTCPTCRFVFTKDMMSTDIALLAKVKKAYADVARREIDNPLYDERIQKGFIALAADLDLQTKEVLKQVSTDLTLMLHDGRLTPQAFSIKMREITDLYV